jgi:hypothetical protein
LLRRLVGRQADPYPVSPEPLAYLKIINRHELDLLCSYASLLFQYHPVQKNLKVLLLAKIARHAGAAPYRDWRGGANDLFRAAGAIYQGHCGLSQYFSSERPAEHADRWSGS